MPALPLHFRYTGSRHIPNVQPHGAGVQIGELVIRFVIGGLVVSLFSLIGHVMRPKTLAGIFGAAPSVALATLGLAYGRKGAAYAAIEARSMVAGAVALGCYSLVVTYLLLGRGAKTLLATVGSWLLWLGIAFGLWAVLLRS